jgi:hypothetical protein
MLTTMTFGGASRPVHRRGIGEAVRCAEVRAQLPDAAVRVQAPCSGSSGPVLRPWRRSYPAPSAFASVQIQFLNAAIPG